MDIVIVKIQTPFHGLKSVPAIVKNTIADLCKRYKKPKSHFPLQPHDINTLEFVVERSCESESQLHFPTRVKDWSPFYAMYKGLAREWGVNLPPNIRRWNVLRKTRVFDIFNDLNAAQEWWLSVRVEHDLLTSHPPSRESIISGCKTHLLCPVDVATLIKIMRVLEVSRGLSNDAAPPVTLLTRSTHFT